MLGLDPTCEGAAVRAQCGVVLHSPSLYSRLSVEQNLDLFGRIWGLKPQEHATRSAELLGALAYGSGTTSRPSGFAAGCSSGWRWRVPCCPRPALLFLDQPTASLNPSLADALRRELAVLAAEERRNDLLDDRDPGRCRANLRTHRAHAQRAAWWPKAAPANSNGAAPESSLEIVGWGFTEEMVALIGHRAEVRHEIMVRGQDFWIDLQSDAHAAPVVNLLVESGAQVEQVLRHAPTLESTYRAIMEVTP